MSSKHGKSGKMGTSSDDTLFGTDKADTIFGRGGNDRIDAGNGNDKVFGGSGNDTIYGGAGNDKIDGGKGNDTIYGGAGNDKIDGGSGRDTAVFSGNYGDYTLKFSNGRNRCDNDDDTVSIVRKVSGSPDGTDTLKNVEVLRFDDGEYRDGQFYPNSGGNTAPVANNDTLAATEDTAVTYSAAQLLGNDTDVDAGTTLAIASVTSGTSGTAVLNGDGTVTFTPTANFNGAASFTYTVSDGALPSAPATVTVNVGAVNDAPVAVADNVFTNVGFDDGFNIPEWALLANDSDPDGDPIDVQDAFNAVDGTVFHTALSDTDGYVQFTDSSTISTELGGSFRYRATDNLLSSSSDGALVTVTNVDGDTLLNGMSGNDILVGSNFFSTTFVGNGGSDILIGGDLSDIFDYNALSDRGTTGDVISGFQKGSDDLDLHDLLATFSGYTPATAFDGGYLQFAQVGGDTLVQIDSNGGADSFETLATLNGVLLNSTDTGDFLL